MRNPLAIVYVVGVLIGLVATDDRWTTRLLVALCWPLGPLSFVVVVMGLTVVAIFLWPLLMLVAGALLGALAITIGWLGD